MFSKLYFFNIFITIVTCADQQNKGRLIIEINGKVIGGGKSVTNGNSSSTINIIRFNITNNENEKLRFTCKYEYESGEYHMMLWMVDNKIIAEKCVGPYPAHDSLTIWPDLTEWTPTSLQCQIYAKSNDVKKCTRKPQTSVAILKYFPKENVTGTVSKSAEKRNSISISGLNESNILPTYGKSSVRYKYRDGDILQLNCTSQLSSGYFYMKWSKNGVELANKNITKDVLTELPVVIPLSKHDDKTIIQCSVIEFTDNPQKINKNKTIELVYESDDEGSIVTTEGADTTDNAVAYNSQLENPSEENKVIYVVTFIVIAIVAIIIITIITISTIKHYKKNKMKEDKITLNGNSVETRWELKCSPETYSDPADVIGNMKNACAVYSSPCKEVVYTTPIPKNLRVVNKIEYENLRTKHQLDHNDVNVKTNYENSNNYNTTYANLNNNNFNNYSNTLCNGNIGSDMYSYIVVDK
ncbi:uncharacterized protein LOC125074947 [Vanessa atalanta]|uniref:uncharacterized protein LOC125074947 n=1 Tax=Vanessa atalanta TaxID=42275 RepID=UPI001FCE0B2D|nr:uncharacterized protein LOC125074947 [Vanessa atalanta]